MRIFPGTTFFVVLVILLSTTVGSGLIPESYTFEDGDSDSLFYKYYEDSGSVEPFENTDFPAAEIISVGYALDRTNQELQIQLEVGSTPIVNASSYYSITIELENTTHKISIRVYFGSIGIIPDSEFDNSSISDIYYQGEQRVSDQQEIEVKVRDTMLYWGVSSSLIDIARIYDDPNMLFSIVRAELEYSINGSSSFGGNGDYYRDSFKLEEFDFAGGVQGEDTDPELFDVVDPIALSLYFGLPTIIILIRMLKRNFQG